MIKKVRLPDCMYLMRPLYKLPSVAGDEEGDRVRNLHVLVPVPTCTGTDTCVWIVHYTMYFIANHKMHACTNILIVEVVEKSCGSYRPSYIYS